VLDALAGMTRGAEGHRVVDALRAFAPTWLLQLPGLLDDADRESLSARSLGASATRMLREMATALVEITAVKSLLLVLEDLHDGDRPTTELLAYVARGREPACLMIVGSYRPDEAATGNHPLRRWSAISGRGDWRN
jgi:hypothetical protein